MARGHAPSPWVSLVLAFAVSAAPAGAQTILGDVNDDSSVSVVDVQLVINATLGIPIGLTDQPDINNDGVVNAVDVRLVINAALGMPIIPEPGDTVTGTHDPVNGLQLFTDGISLSIPGGALDSPTEISLKRAAPEDLPAPLPGGAGLAGGVFGPSGLAFAADAAVQVVLGAPTLLPALPVLTFDSTRNEWIGTGTMADVEEDGVTASFALSHFSIAGIPDPVPIPDPGDSPGSFIVLSNNGTLETDAISSTEAALLYSAFGTNFSISAISQTVTMGGEIDTKAIGLSSILVLQVDNYIVGIVGGPNSLYDAGGLPEPVLGVMIMSMQGQDVSLSLHAATLERIIQGTLTGRM